MNAPSARDDRLAASAPDKMLGTALPTATVVKMLPTRIWIENGMLGERFVVVQHEGCEPFDYATFGYDHRYTSNSGTWNAAHRLALGLGATEPVEQRQRGFHMPTADELREQIKLMQEEIACIERSGGTDGRFPVPHG